MVECLHNTSKALGQVPSTEKKKNSKDMKVKGAVLGRWKGKEKGVGENKKE
jgi:hypothetical protein